ncbi:MAG: DNA repair protein RecO [Patescibacteria group bacterium]
MLYSGQAIVLKRRAFKENDFLATILSKEHGKIDLVVKSGAKITSKLASPLSGIYCVEFTAARGRELDRLTFSSIIERFDSIETNWDARIQAIQITEIIDRLISEKSADQEIYNQTLEALRALNNLKNEKVGKLLVYRFLWLLLYKLGTGPETKSCVNCKNNENLSHFSFSHGGMLCATCRQADDSAQNIPAAALAMLSSSKLSNGWTSADDISLFIKIARLWGEQHTHRPIKSLNF